MLRPEGAASIATPGARKSSGSPWRRAVDPPFDRFCSDEYSDNNASEYKDKNASFPWTAFSLRYTAAAWVFLPTGRGRVALGGDAAALGKLQSRSMRSIGREWLRNTIASSRASPRRSWSAPPGLAARPALAGEDMPVFIVGMPRSGTTLVEQILSSHPAVGAGGELRFWRYWFQGAGAVAAFPEAGALSKAAEDYLAALRQIGARCKAGHRQGDHEFPVALAASAGPSGGPHHSLPAEPGRHLPVDLLRQLRGASLVMPGTAAIWCSPIVNTSG